MINVNDINDARVQGASVSTQRFGGHHASIVNCRF